MGINDYPIKNKYKWKWVETRRREWDEHVTRMDAERILIVKISRDSRLYLPEDLQAVRKHGMT